MNKVYGLSNKIIFLVVFIAYMMFHLPSIGHDNFNTDVWKWKSRSYDFGSGVFSLDFEKTIQKYHPGVTLMWIGTAGVKFYNLYYDLFNGAPPQDNLIKTVFELDMVQKFLLSLVLGAVFSMSVTVLRTLTNISTALVFAFLYLVEPFNLALTRVFHLEGLMTGFMILSALLLAKYIRFGKMTDFVFSSSVAALAVLTKTSSIYMFFFTGLILGLMFLHKSKWDIRGLQIKSIAKLTAYWVFVFIGTFSMLWPAVWVAPQKVLEVLYRGVAVIGVERDHVQYYFGELIDSPGPEYYLVVSAYRSSLILFVSSVILVLKGLIELVILLTAHFKYKRPLGDEGLLDVTKNLTWYFILFASFYVLEISLTSKKLDRYLLPAMVGMLVPVSIFLNNLFINIKRFDAKVLSFLIVVVGLWIPLKIHPDYLSYYNPLYGGLEVGARVLEPKWMIGVPELLKYFSEIKVSENIPDAPFDASLNELAVENTAKDYLVVGFPEKYYTQIWPFFRDINSWAVIEDMTALSKHASYFVFPVWEDPYSFGQNVPDGLHFKDTILIRGVEIYNVYAKNNF